MSGTPTVDPVVDVIAGVVLDLDGTVYLSGQPLPGAVAAVRRLRDAGRGVVFVSNNPLVPAQVYADRLSGMGIAVDPEDVLTSGGLTARWLAEHHRGDRVLLVSEASLRDEIEAHGVEVTERPGDAEVVVVSFDRTFDYTKWRAAFDALRLGARFVATNPDATCPVEGGELPDCAGIIAALEATTGRRLGTVIGKPSAIAAAAALNRLSNVADRPLLPDEILVAGDRLETDIRLGVDAGFVTALLLSGVTDAAAAAASSIRPDHVLGGLAELPEVVLAVPARTASAFDPRSQM